MPAPHALDTTDRSLLEALEQRLPMDHRPFEVLGERFGLDEEACLERVTRLKAQGHVRRIAARLDIHVLGYRTVLTALRVPAARAQLIAATVNAYPGTVQTIELDDPWRLWSLLEVPPTDSPEQVLQMVRALSRAEDAALFSVVRGYPVRREGATGDPLIDHLARVPDRLPSAVTTSLQDLDRRLLRIVQDDLPLVEIPYAIWAEQADISETALFGWLKRMEHVGYVRDVAASLAPRNAQAGCRISAAWQVPEQEIDAVGEEVAKFREVGACVRVIGGPAWPYTLLAIIQGDSAASLSALAERITERIGGRPQLILTDLRTYGKTPATYFSPDFELWWKHASEQLNIHNQ